jgi:hypothetical protein
MFPARLIRALDCLLNWSIEMRKLRISLVFLCLALHGLQTIGEAASISNTGSPQSEVIIEGLGVGGIIVGNSRMSDVVLAYGEGFKLVQHNKYSYEAKYNDLGLSFYYCYSDEEKKIFTIKIKPPFHGSTNKGIIVGESTLQDVFDLYGKVKPYTTTALETWAFKYEGVEFHIAYDSNLNSVGDEIPEEQLKKKIISIDVMVTNLRGNACRPSN